jgi:hypothetical protein
VPRKSTAVEVCKIGKYSISESQRDKFYARLEPLDSGCIVWVGCRHPSGHGKLTIGIMKDKTQEYAHRVAWVLAGREIVPGMHLMHHCPGGDNPACCNVEHMSIGTMSEHAHDRLVKEQMRPSLLGLPRGVYRQRSGSGYGAKFKRQYLGTFRTAEEAGRARNEAKAAFLKSLESQT